jgi:hypothetical protein
MGMGLLYEYFTAADDRAAAAMLTAGLEPPTFLDEVNANELHEIETLLTGRSAEEITTDPRFHALLAEQAADSALAGECGVVTVTDSLTRALAAADDAELRAVGVAWLGAGSAWQGHRLVRGLAEVARHAVQHGHRMYCFWYV